MSRPGTAPLLSLVDALVAREVDLSSRKEATTKANKMATSTNDLWRFVAILFATMRQSLCLTLSLVSRCFADRHEAVLIVKNLTNEDRA
jgi:hypothetical protein